MSAATTSTTDMLAGPVLVIRPGVQNQVIKRGQTDYNLAICLGEPTGAGVPVAQCNVTFTTARTAVKLLDDADATWEDATWQ